MKQSNRVLAFVFCVATSTFAHAQRSYTVSADLHEVTNLKSFLKAVPLQKAHLNALHNNLFVVSPSNDKALYWVYGRNDYQSLPSIVTSDNILQIYHIFFESTLRGVEKKLLVPELRKMTRAMLRQANTRYTQQRKGALAQAALKNVAFFGVAARLLGQNDTIAPGAKPMVQKELALIKAAKGEAAGSIFPYDIDYSQFIVRGHYTNTPELRRYFQTMMWFGLTPFAASTHRDGRVAENPVPIQQALLIMRDLKDSGAETRWRKVYDITSLFAGESNSLTPDEWRGYADTVFGANAPVSAYLDKKRITQFVKVVSDKTKPQIVSKKTSGANPDAVQFRFMGQRAIPDSIILQRLSGDDRPFPDPLDVFSVIGSGRATKILDDNANVYNPGGWSGYESERDTLKKEFASLPAPSWNKNLYWSWFDSLRKIIAPANSDFPAFMKSQAWADHSLYSSLASWAELRHDTILYGLQTGAEMGDGPPPPIKGYVEPNLPSYTRMEALVHQTQNELRKRGYSSYFIQRDFNEFLDIVKFCREASEQELNGKKLSNDDYLRIRQIEGELEHAHNWIQLTTSGYETLSADALDIALVSDVHSANGQALTVGVGRADHLFAIVPIEGKLWLTRGSTLSYYQFKRPVSGRMSDEAWKHQLNAGQAPERPSWIKSFFVPIKVKGKDD